MALTFKKSDVERFWAKVHCPGGDACWEWAGGINGHGYGSFHVGTACIAAHRFAWLSERGEIPEGMLVCHHCDNRRCVRVSHLFLGTNADNMADMTSKGRRQSLSWEQIVEIRALLARNTVQRRIAERFGVSAATITAIKRGYRYNQRGIQC